MISSVSEVSQVASPKKPIDEVMNLDNRPPNLAMDVPASYVEIAGTPLQLIPHQVHALDKSFISLDSLIRTKPSSSRFQTLMLHILAKPLIIFQSSLFKMLA